MQRSLVCTADYSSTTQFLEVSVIAPLGIRFFLADRPFNPTTKKQAERGYPLVELDRQHRRESSPLITAQRTTTNVQLHNEPLTPPKGSEVTYLYNTVVKIAHHS